MWADERDHCRAFALIVRSSLGGSRTTTGSLLILLSGGYDARGVGTILEDENTGEVVQLVSSNFDSRCANLPKS